MCVIAKMSFCSYLIWAQVKGEVLKSVYEPLFYSMINWYQIPHEGSPLPRGVGLV